MRELSKFMQTIQNRLQQQQTDAKARKHLQHELSKLRRQLQHVTLSEVRVRFQDEEESVASSRLESLGRVGASSSRSNSRSGRHTPTTSQDAMASDAIKNSILKQKVNKSPSPEPSSQAKVTTDSDPVQQLTTATNHVVSRERLNEETEEDTGQVENVTLRKKSLEDQLAEEEIVNNELTSSNCVIQDEREEIVVESIEVGSNEADTNKIINQPVQSNEINSNPDQSLIAQLAVDMLQQLRITGELPYIQCQQVLFDLLKCLQRLPTLGDTCNQLVAVLCNSGEMLDGESVCRQSQDFDRIDNLLHQLRPFARDTQQHHWPSRRDEGTLADLLQSLHTLLHRANRAVVLLRARQHDYECVREWIEHVQEERQPLVRLWLHRCLLLIGLLDPIGVASQLLGSSLPVHLTNQLIKTPSALKSRARRVRWLAAARLHTLTLSSGQQPCSGLYTPIDRSAIEQLLTLIEKANDESSGTNEQADDQQLDAIHNQHEDQIDTSRLTMDDLVAPLLAFNLRFESDHHTQNPLSLVLVERPEVAALLLPHLALQLNWFEDPTSLTALRSQVEKQFGIKLPYVQSHCRSSVYVKNAVLKFLIEVFAVQSLATSMYVNDVSVLVDIVVTHLNNLPADDEVTRTFCNYLVNESILI